MHLQVDVAERTIEGAHEVLDLLLLASPAVLDVVVKGGVGTGGDVQEGVCAHQRKVAVHALGGAQHLPDPPDTVDHGVVKVEGRVAGRGVDITAGVAAEGVVATAVDANVTASGDALHHHLEVVDVLGLEDVVEDAGGVGVSRVDGIAEISLQAARVPRKGVGDGQGGAAGQVEGRRAQVDGHVLEGTSLDTTATGTGGQVDGRQARGGAEDDILLARDVRTVAAHGVVAAIEHGRRVQAGDGGDGPVPVLRLGVSWMV